MVTFTITKVRTHALDDRTYTILPVIGIVDHETNVLHMRTFTGCSGSSDFEFVPATSQLCDFARTLEV